MSSRDAARRRFLERSRKGPPAVSLMAAGPLRPIVSKASLEEARAMFGPDEREDDLVMVASALDATKRGLTIRVGAGAAVVLFLVLATVAWWVSTRPAPPAPHDPPAPEIVPLPRETRPTDEQYLANTLPTPSAPENIGSGHAPPTAEAEAPPARDAAAACRRGSAGDCLTAGVRAEHAEDETTAAELYERGCLLHNARSCYNAGRLAMLRESDEALRFFGPSCEAGFAPACWQLARVEWRVGRSPELEAHLGTACTGGEADACDRLGILAFRDEDDETAVRHFERSCTLGAPGGCGNLAYHLYRGRGVTEDRDRAIRLYGQACDGGIPSACSSEVTILEARGVPSDDERLTTARRQGCRLGVRSLCDDPE